MLIAKRITVGLFVLFVGLYLLACVGVLRIGSGTEYGPGDRQTVSYEVSVFDQIGYKAGGRDAGWFRPMRCGAPFANPC